MTYLLLTCRYYFTTTATAEGWEFYYPSDNAWVSVSDPSRYLNAAEVHLRYDGKFTRCEKTPILVGGKKELFEKIRQEHLKNVVIEKMTTAKNGQG